MFTRSNILFHFVLCCDGWWIILMSLTRIMANARKMDEPQQILYKHIKGDEVTLLSHVFMLISLSTLISTHADT